MLTKNKIFSFRFLLYGQGVFTYNTLEMFFIRIRQIAQKLAVFFAASLLFSFFCPPLFAGEDLASLTQEALNNNRDIKEASERLEATRHRIAQSSALPNPTAGTAVMGKDLETPLGPQKNIYEYEQMIPFPGKLVKKRQAATAEKDISEAQLNKVKRDVV